jgi:hypothetical protein
MKVQIVNNQYVHCVKEVGDLVFKNSGWTNAESIFLYHVKNELIKQGYDVIKKQMWKDGHMVSMGAQYIRTRKYFENKDGFCTYNQFYATEDAGLEFNKKGEYDLVILLNEDYE